MFNVVTETSETHVDKTERKRGAVVKLQQSRNSGKCYMFSLRCLDLQPKEVRSELSGVYGGDRISSDFSFSQWPFVLRQVTYFSRRNFITDEQVPLLHILRS